MTLQNGAYRDDQLILRRRFYYWKEDNVIGTFNRKCVHVERRGGSLGSREKKRLHLK